MVMINSRTLQMRTNNHFKSDNPLFFKEIKEVWTIFPPNVVYFLARCSSRNPNAVLSHAIDSLAVYIIVERHPFIEGDASVISLQETPRRIVESSYPVWLFNEAELRRAFSRKYSEVAAFDALDGIIGHGRLKATFKGIVFKKIDRGTPDQ